MKRICVMVAATVLLHGCGAGSETKAPKVKAESAFTCDQVNNLVARGNRQSAGRMIQAGVDQLAKAYTEDTAIQKFFRNFVQKNTDYRFQFANGILKTCLATPSLGVNDAATAALNDLYAVTSKQVRWATCRYFNDKTITTKNVVQEALHPTSIHIGGDVVAYNVKTIAASEKYGEAYLQKGVSEYCDANSDERLWSTFGNVAAPAVEEISMEQERIRKEQERIREEREKETQRKQNLSKYGTNLVTAGTATCENFGQSMRLVDASQDREQFEKAINETLRSLAQQLPSRQQAAFVQEFNGNSADLAKQVHLRCPGIGSNGDAGSLLKALQGVSAKYARIEGLQFFDKLRKEKKALAQKNCDGRSECISALEERAAAKAGIDFDYCEQGGRIRDLICFDRPQSYYDYALALLNISEEERKIRMSDGEQKRQLKNLIQYYNYDSELEVCRRKVRDAGYRGEEYQVREKAECLEPITEAIVAPIRAKKDEATTHLQKWTSVANTLAAQARVSVQ